MIFCQSDGLLRFGQGIGKNDRKPASLPGRAVHSDLPLMLVDDESADGQPDTRAMPSRLVRGSDLPEHLEDPLLILLPNADAGILHLDAPVMVDRMKA